MDMCEGGAYIRVMIFKIIKAINWIKLSLKKIPQGLKVIDMVNLDIVKSMTDMCDGGAYIKQVIVV
jgi:hypothetical protein